MDRHHHRCSEGIVVGFGTFFLIRGDTGIVGQRPAKSESTVTTMVMLVVTLP